MNQILNKVRDVDPNDSDAVKEALTAYFQNLSKHAEVDCNRWLRSLENILNRFPKYCTGHRNTIETLLAQFLDSNNYYNVIEAAKCAHALQQIRPSQEKGANAKLSWREQMSTLCNAAHLLIGAIFVNTAKIYKNYSIEQKDQAPSNTPLSMALINITNVAKAQNKQTLLCTRLRNVFVFIQAMLVEIYPVAKPVRPQIILEVILQSLSVSSSKNVALDVTEVKTQALRTLDALIVCLGPNLIPFSALVFRFVMQTLRWSSDNVNEESRKVRRSAYNSLAQWLDMLHVHRAHTEGNAQSWQDELTSHVVEDITPPKRVMQLTMNAQPTRHLSKKAKRKLANTMLQESKIASHMPGEKNKISIPEEINDEVAIAALECAETFMSVCGMFLKPATHKIFQEVLVRECYSISTYSEERGLSLLRVLEVCRKCCPASEIVSPPTHYCLHLYSDLINSHYRHISKFCSQALLDIRLHLHCSPPSLNFAVEVHPEKKQAAHEKRHKISDRNRAVLESLLGAERMPSEDLAEEVITIPDEPTNKKPRLEESPAKISVSSDSEKSVVISDDSDVEDSTELVELVIDEVNNEVEEPEMESVLTIVEENIQDDTKETNQAAGNVDTVESNNTDENKVIDATITKEIVTETNELVNVTQKDNIFEAKTQLPANISNDSPERSPLSMEVAYDYPNTGNDKVTVLEKLDDENLPSTNDTDDIQITCGQLVKSSQEVDAQKNKDLETGVDEPKVNGVNTSPEKVVENGDIQDNVTSKTAPYDKVVTVEDMLADFVDEVNDDGKTQA